MFSPYHETRSVPHFAWSFAGVVMIVFHNTKAKLSSSLHFITQIMGFFIHPWGPMPLLYRVPIAGMHQTYCETSPFAPRDLELSVRKARRKSFRALIKLNLAKQPQALVFLSSLWPLETGSQCIFSLAGVVALRLLIVCCHLRSCFPKTRSNR